MEIRVNDNEKKCAVNKIQLDDEVFPSMVGWNLEWHGDEVISYHISYLINLTCSERRLRITKDG